MQIKEEIINYFTELFPEPKCELDYSTPFELLIAVMLSAQCTDKLVNRVTGELFKHYSNPSQLSEIDINELERIIKPCGFYHSKAKHIKSASSDIITKFGGQIPKSNLELQSLAGVGRKTANVICSVIYGENVIAVDTHVLRVSNRLKLSKSNNPIECERDLTEIFKTDLDKLHFRMVLFGRYYCKAKKPNCENCKLKQYCKLKTSRK